MRVDAERFGIADRQLVGTRKVSQVCPDIDWGYVEGKGIKGHLYV